MPETETAFAAVSNRVENLLRTEFGASNVGTVDESDDRTIFGFIVDGVAHSLVVNVTP